jgi:hypothetical protein
MPKTKLTTPAGSSTKKNNNVSVGGSPFSL